MFSSKHDTDQIDDARRDQGNCFRTEAEATRERDRRALIHELRSHPKACGFQTEADCNFSLTWSRGKTAWVWDTHSYADTCPASGYFSEAVDGLIEQFGERLNLLRDVA